MCTYEQHVRRTLTLTHTITGYSVSGNVVRVRILISVQLDKSRVEKEFIPTFTYAWHTNVRWASEPHAIVQYFIIVDDTAVVVADGVLLTGVDKRRISDSQQIVFTDKNDAFS